MSGLAHGEWDTPELRRILEVREDALGRGDVSLVAECDAALERKGAPAPKVEVALPPAEMETAVPPRKRTSSKK